MANRTYKYFILTGDPGVGKTTLIKKICTYLSEKGVKTVGFYTEEVKYDRIREGFDVVALDGSRGRLARAQNLLKIPVKFRVGKYGVLVQEFENIAMPCLELQKDTSNLLVIDEIGKMEFFSDVFKKRIREIFSPQSDYIVLATIPIRKSDAIIESIRNNDMSKVWTVTRENRNNIEHEIIEDMKNTLKFR